MSRSGSTWEKVTEQAPLVGSAVRRQCCKTHSRSFCRTSEALKRGETEWAFTRPRKELWVVSDYSRMLLKGKAGFAYQVWQCYIFSFSKLILTLPCLPKIALGFLSSQALKELNSVNQLLMVHGLGEEWTLKTKSMDDPPAGFQLVTGLLLLKYCKRVTSRQGKTFSHSFSLFPSFPLSLFLSLSFA